MACVAPYKHMYEGTGVARNSIAYGVAKAGIIQMTKYLATTWARARRARQCHQPGRLLEAGQAHTASSSPTTTACRPTSAAATICDLKGAVVFLASDASAHVLGQNINGRRRLDAVVIP